LDGPPPPPSLPVAELLSLLPLPLPVGSVGSSPPLFVGAAPVGTVLDEDEHATTKNAVAPAARKSKRGKRESMTVGPVYGGLARFFPGKILAVAS